MGFFKRLMAILAKAAIVAEKIDVELTDEDPGVIDEDDWEKLIKEDRLASDAFDVGMEVIRLIRDLKKEEPTPE